MSYRNPQQVVDTQTGQHYRNLQKSLSNTFAGVAQSYKAEQDRLEKERKKKEAAEKAVRDFNQSEEDTIMNSVAKLKAQNPTLDTSAIYDMIDRYSDIKNAIDLGTITDKAELRKMREQLAQIKSIPDGLNASLVGFGALTEDFTEYIARAGKKGGLDLKSADPKLLNHLNVFLNKSKGDRKFQTQFDENGNMRTGIFLKSSEEGDEGKFYTKDELVSYMNGATGGLPTIPDDTEASEELVSNVFGVDPITKKMTKPMPGIVDKVDVTQRDGSIKVEERINEEKLKEKLKPIALSNVSSWGNAGIVSYYNNMLKPGELLEDKDGKEIKVLKTEDLDEDTKDKIADLYLNKFIKDKGILNYGKTLEKDTTTRRPNVYSGGSKKTKDITKIDTSFIDELDIQLSGQAPGKMVDFNDLEKRIKPLGFRIKESKEVNGVLEFDITKSGKGADNYVTITEDMSPDEIKRLLKFVETGSLPTEDKEPTGSEDDPLIYKPQK